MKKEFITFDQILQELDNSSELVSKLNNFDKIISVTRGGLVVAGILSHFVDCRWYDTACIKLYSDEHSEERLELIKINPTDDEVLIVDDVVDTGKSIEELKKYFPNSKVFTLHYKPNHSANKPDFYLWESTKWLVYPWEKD